MSSAVDLKLRDPRAYGPSVDHSGERHGLLIILEYAGRDTYRKGYWRCVCDCGAVTVVRWEKLREGRIVSCGCKRATPRG